MYSPTDSSNKSSNVSSILCECLSACVRVSLVHRGIISSNLTATKTWILTTHTTKKEFTGWSLLLPPLPEEGCLVCNVTPSQVLGSHLTYRWWWGTPYTSTVGVGEPLHIDSWWWGAPYTSTELGEGERWARLLEAANEPHVSNSPVHLGTPLCSPTL